jgi:hypothetical protein
MPPAWLLLTRVDCSKDFSREEFRVHTSCASGAEKYQGKLYVDSGNVQFVCVCVCVCVWPSGCHGSGSPP